MVWGRDLASLFYMWMSISFTVWWQDRCFPIESSWYPGWNDLTVNASFIHGILNAFLWCTWLSLCQDHPVLIPVFCLTSKWALQLCSSFPTTFWLFWSLYFILIQHFVWIVVTYTQRKMCSAAGGKYLTELRLKQSAFMPSISVYLLGIPFFYSSKSPDYACWSVWSSSFSITWVAELFPYPARELSLSEN